MDYYNRDVSVNRQKRLARRVRSFVLLMLLILLAFILAIGMDAFRQKRETNELLGRASVTVINSSLREYGSDYFTFTAHESWRLIVDEGTPNKFIYRSYRGDLVEQELIIYVNESNPSLVATRVLPVRIENGTKLVLGEVSDHCGKNSTVRNIVPVTVEQTTINCQTDGTNFVTVVAERGGNTNLKLNHNGSAINYNLIYRNSTFSPDSTQLVDILNSFSSL